MPSPSLPLRDRLLFAAMRLWAALWIALLVAGFADAVVERWISDDIFITFRYADNVLRGWGPVYNAGEHSEGYTHFLWFLLLTIGRRLAVPAEVLGAYLAFPFFLGILFLLLRFSRRMFPERGGLAGIPVAALLWVAIEDVRLFASGGLETTMFLFLLLLGFDFMAVSRHRQRWWLSSWAFALATLTRPEGLAFAAMAGFYAWWRQRWSLGFAAKWAVVYFVLVAPVFCFRLSYYGLLFPNPYYAKSGGGANWIQGWTYFKTYFNSYFVLLLGLGGLLVAVWRCWRPKRDRVDRPAAFLWVWLAAVFSILYVTRVGGDFMFARFYLPATLLLVLLLELLVQQLPRKWLRLVCVVVLAAGMFYGSVRKHELVGDREHVWGIVDEPQYYPDKRLERVRANARALKSCLADTDAVIMVQGGQASLAYYADFPVAIERYGLTDRAIAMSPAPEVRGRPGHEKLADAQYLFDRGLQLRIHNSLIRSLPQFVLIAFAGPVDKVYGEIIIYKRKFMDQLKKCPGIVFLDFPIWLDEFYFPRMKDKLPHQILRDYNWFLRYYFNHNEDPENLLPRLESAMRGLGVEPQVHPLRPDFFEDTARPSLLPPHAEREYFRRRRGG